MNYRRLLVPCLAIFLCAAAPLNGASGQADPDQYEWLKTLFLGFGALATMLAGACFFSSSAALLILIPVLAVIAGLLMVGCAPFVIMTAHDVPFAASLGLTGLLVVGLGIALFLGAAKMLGDRS